MIISIRAYKALSIIRSLSEPSLKFFLILTLYYIKMLASLTDKDFNNSSQDHSHKSLLYHLFVLSFDEDNKS